MRILLVEPDEYYHAQFRQNLEDLADLIILSSSQEAMGTITQAIPDILIMELALPDKSGYALLEQIRREKKHSLLPIIIFSETGHLEDIKAALDLGVSGYFVKGKNTINDVRKLLLSLTNV